jgi:hypothetical protein
MQAHVTEHLDRQEEQEKQKLQQQQENEARQREPPVENRAMEGARAAELQSVPVAEPLPLRHPPKLVLALMSGKDLANVCAEWGLLHNGEKQKPQSVPLEALKERWRKFLTAASTARDVAAMANTPPNYGAVSKEVLRVDKEKAKQSTHPFFASPNGRSEAVGNRMGDTFDALIAATRARGYNGGPPEDWKSAGDGGDVDEPPAKRSRAVGKL